MVAAAGKRHGVDVCLGEGVAQTPCFTNDALAAHSLGGTRSRPKKYCLHLPSPYPGWAAHGVPMILALDFALRCVTRAT